MTEITNHGFGIVSETTEMSGIVKRDGKVVKRFRGETAWSDAERLAYDLAHERQYSLSKWEWEM